MKKIAGLLLYHVFLSAVLCLPAICNGYPFVYHDIGAYLKAGFRLLPDGDRFLGYGLFLRLASLSFTLWSVVLLQGLIVSLLLFQVEKKFSGRRSPYLFHLLVIIILTAGTGAGWFVSTPMPDIFAAGAILTVFLTLIEPPSFLRLLPLLGLLCLFEISHFSHILLAIFLIAALAAVFALSAAKRKYLPRLLAALFTTVLSVTLLSFHNYLRGNGFVPSLSSNVFFVARLSDTPVLQRYLEENADRKELSLVEFRESLPDSYSAFLWNRESPFRRVYGWNGPTESFRLANREYGIIVREVISTPRYLLPLLRVNARDTFRQLARIRILEPAKIYTENDPVYRAVEKYFPRESGRFLSSRQNRGAIRWSFVRRMDVIDTVILIIALVGIISRLVLGRMREKLSILILVITLGVFLNSAVTASLAMVVDRLQARVSWLIVFAGLVCGWDWCLHPFREKGNV